MSRFDFPSQQRERFRARQLRRRVKMSIGLILLIVGGALLGVSPHTETGSILVQIIAGFVCLFVGFWLAVMPLLSTSSREED